VRLRHHVIAISFSMSLRTWKSRRFAAYLVGDAEIEPATPPV
jgi:hypothetical protein